MADDRDDTHEERIRQLKAAVAAAGGPIRAANTGGLPPDVEEQFWRRILAFETSGTTTLVKELSAIGVELPEPDDLDDVSLRAALWTIIEALATLHVYLHSTDHLSDRELYTRLVRELLPEEMDALDTEGGWTWHLDVLGDDQYELYLKYYADEATRESERIDFPDAPIPAHEDPPYRRDRDLPRAL